jgi:hypothetical protein
MHETKQRGQGHSPMTKEMESKNVVVFNTYCIQGRRRRGHARYSNTNNHLADDTSSPFNVAHSSSQQQRRTDIYRDNNR